MSQGVDFAELFDRSPNPYMVLDRELRYVAANEAYLRVIGARLDRLLGRRVTDVYPNDPDDPNNDSAQLVERRGGDDVHGEAAVRYNGRFVRSRVSQEYA